MIQQEPLEVKMSEKYYLEKGHGIQQLLAVSLDEEIKLHDFPSFIQLKGEFILEGEYAYEEVTYEGGEKHQFPQRKYMQTVEEIDEEVAYFRQIIPIDITIPKSNIDHMDDVSVAIHHFDYSIPTAHIFILFATLHVNGIVKREKQDNQTNKGQEESEGIEPFVREEQEMKKKKKEEKHEEPSRDGDTKKEPSNNEEVRHTKEQEDKTVDGKTLDVQAYNEESDEIADDQIKEVQEASPNHYHGKSRIERNQIESEAEKWEEDHSEEDFSLEKRIEENSLHMVEDEVIEEDVHEKVERIFTKAEEFPSTDDVVDNNDLPDGLADEGSSFLTDLFGEEDLASLSMYVVQEGDSVELIAEKYGIAPSVVLRHNPRAEEDVVAGDVLAIYR